MELKLIALIVLDVVALYFIYRFMATKLRGKLRQVEARHQARWDSEQE